MKLSHTRIVAAFVAILGLAATAQAQNVIVRSLDAAEAAKVRAAVEASMQAAARGQRVGMVTGTVNPQPVMSRNGMVSQELDASTLMFSVARVNADGGIDMVCINSLESAQAALTAPSFAKRISPSSKEGVHVSK
jgi:hypothetical protein